MAMVKARKWVTNVITAAANAKRSVMPTVLLPSWQGTEECAW